MSQSRVIQVTVQIQKTFERFCPSLYRVSVDILWISTESIGSMDIYRRAYGILWILIGEFGRNLCHFWVSGHPVDSMEFSGF